MQKAIFLGHNALGDTLCTTPVLRAFRAANPEIFTLYITHNAAYCRVLDGNPDIDVVLYNEYMLLNGLKDFRLEWLYSLPIDIDKETHLYHFDLRQVCTTWDVFEEHISKAFARLLKIPIDSTRPTVVINDYERRAARSYLRRPSVIFSMHSVTNPARKDGAAGGAKDWPLERWLCLARQIHAAGDYDVIAVGSEFDPRVATPDIRNLYGLPIKILAAMLSEAACVVTLENGVAHLSAAVDAPTVEIYSDVVPLGWAFPEDATRWKVFRGDPRAISCEQIAEAVLSVLAERGRS